MKTIKIYLTQYDGIDIVSETGKGRVGLYDTHDAFDQNGNKMIVEIHLKEYKEED